MQKKQWIRTGVRWGVLITGILLCLLFVIGICPYHGNAMAPALADGDLLIIYRPGRCQTGDVVCYRDPEGRRRVARIAASEGQEVSFTDDGWLVDGYIPNERIEEQTLPVPGADVTFPHVVKGWFLLNDRRSAGEDSRTFGDIAEEAILGKVVFVFRIRGI